MRCIIPPHCEQAGPAAEGWYRELGIAAITQAAEGDGSLWAARHGYDFDIESYRSREACRDLEEPQIRAFAVVHMMKRPGVLETVPGDDAPRRESVKELLDRLSQTYDGRLAVEQLRSRLPRADLSLPAEPLLSPRDLAEFGQPLEALDGRPLGREVLLRTGWSGIKRLASEASSSGFQ